MSLDDYRSVWTRKPLLRRVYGDFYDRIIGHCAGGPTLEIGGGIGQLKARLPEVIASDIQYAPWLDLVADAQALPFAANSLGNLVMLDVLHHIEYPIVFLREAARVLRPGGRIVMIEPAITWGSSLFYRLLHHEPVRMDVDPLAEGARTADRDPYDSNQATPTLLFGRERERLAARLPSMQLVRVEWMSLWVYPLSGGFQRWSLLADPLAAVLLKWEKRLERTVGRYFAFRLLAVMEKNPSAP